MDNEEYVYSDVADVLKAVKDDLTSPHLRKPVKKGLMSEAKRTKKSGY